MKTHPKHGAGGALLAALATARATVATLEAAVERAKTTPDNDAPELLALRQCGVSVRTLRGAIGAAELPAVKVGREFKVRRVDLDAWLEARAVRPRERNAPEREMTAAERAIERARRTGSLRVVGGAR